MGNYTPDEISKSFVVPIIKAAKRLQRAARRLKRVIAEQDTPFDYAPLRATMAEKAVAELTKFSRHVADRIAGIEEGSCRFRENEKTQLREQYRTKKDSKDNKKPPEH